MRNTFLLIWLILGTSSAFGQISPSGLGATNMAGWFAVGINQDLNPLKSNGWQSTTYIGLGRMSNPDNHNPLYKSGILVFNQEFKNRFHEHWEYSLALSYRRQNRYEDLAPYEKAQPPLKQEFRLYGRFSYIVKTPFVEITPTFRQEIQKYYTPDFKNYRESLRLRSRFRLKFAFPLTPDKRHRLLLFSEQLFSTSQRIDPRYWTPFEYKDSRFTVYYSWAPETVPFVFDLGYMNDLIGVKSPTSTHFLALDVIWKNPFSR